MTNRACNAPMDFFMGRPARRLRRMLPPVNAARGMAAACGTAAALLLGGAVAGYGSPRIESARSAATMAVAAAPAPQAAEAGERPDAGDLSRAFLRLRRWLDAFALPGADDPQAAVAIRNCGGVCVVIRRSGRVVGTGMDFGTDALALRRAAGSALADLLDSGLLRALPPGAQREYTASLTLELNAAGPLTPLPARAPARVARQLEPGIDGVAVRRGESITGFFPAQLLAMNAADRVERLLRGTMADDGALALPEGRSADDVTFYRFRTVHLAQREAGQPPFVAVRGDTVVPQAAADADGVAAMADALAGHLVARRWPELDRIEAAASGDTDGAAAEEAARALQTLNARGLGLRGDYEPTAHQYEPLIAPPMQQALAVLALRRYARAPGADAQTAAQARRVADEVLHDLAIATPAEEDATAALPACAAIVCAVLESRDAARDPAVAGLLSSAARRVRQWAAQRVDAERATTARDPHVQALLAWALARLAAAEANATDASSARELLRDLAADESPDVLLSAQPWALWAALELPRGAKDEGDLLLAEPMRALVTALDALRVPHAAASAAEVPPDLHGGLLLRGGAADHTRPTSQTARPAAFAATAIRTRALVDPPQAAAALQHHLKTMRFLMQLQIRKDDGWALREPAAALGGVRNAPWDAAQPVAAQVMALFAAAETLHTLDALDDRTRSGSRR